MERNNNPFSDTSTRGKNEAERERLKKELIRKAHVVGRIMNTADGKEFLEILKAEFDLPFLVDRDSHLTYSNIGQRNVVVYIEQLHRLFLKETSNEIQV